MRTSGALCCLTYLAFKTFTTEPTGSASAELDERALPRINSRRST